MIRETPAAVSISRILFIRAATSGRLQQAACICDAPLGNFYQKHHREVQSHYIDATGLVRLRADDAFSLGRRATFYLSDHYPTSNTGKT
jgi:hypothetical protein